MQRSFLTFLLVLAAVVGQAQEETYQKPKLVVGIVVDQMRYDYIPRFWDRYGEGGFKKLINEGFNCKNNHYNYAPTKTGPGHASVYTGTTPATHGIIANDWYDKELKKYVYCAEDDSVQPIGTKDASHKMSPWRMLSSTMTDELKLATQGRGKVIGISVKDRGAILPAGHAADAAYWFQGKDEGAWITSSFYMNELPKWVTKFNKSKAAAAYKKSWNTLYDIETYTASGPDDTDFEGKFSGEERPVFPHDLKKLWLLNKGYDIIKATPYGNSITADFAIAALEGEQLGTDDITDFLAVSFSSTDYVGHKFGVNSVEVEDTYLRLDKDLERLLKALDEKVGKGNYTVFLTADHAAVQPPSYLKTRNIPAGYIDVAGIKEGISEFLETRFKSKNLIENVSNDQIFLNADELKKLNLTAEEVEKALAQELLNYDDVAQTYTATEMRAYNYTEGIPYKLQKGFNHKRSGNVIIVFKPAYISYSPTGSTHGSPYNYDANVPFLLYGFGVNHGSTYERTEITDIAPTICALLGISFPNGAIGNPVVKALK
ncbi:alkaline phosphatase PafA [Neptunitalea lumnitzerae]|uniref:Alkaline phosphatase family protein n=1 Tax=Neptunitalea lumnitzerae TaxID=2965509 RepID=A0ABQ5MHB3_9FLAO|nr:alkaline phosphatase PafA [Neptunitalea sp. Y10]GLB48794.1 alkaline phosphatase family protein [Neptunitalea sp. Y10]